MCAFKRSKKGMEFLMGLLNIFKKNKNKIGNDIFSIPCDYDGYDLVFKSGTTDPKLYEEFNEIITNNQFDISQLNEYKQLKIDSDEELFATFYDCWVEELKKEKYLSHLDKHNGIENFSKEINQILNNIKSSKTIDVDSIVERYKDELKKYTLDGKKIDSYFNYDILEANIVADELRKIGYELIKLFNGYDNDDTAIIPLNKIEKLKLIESKIK